MAPEYPPRRSTAADDSRNRNIASNSRNRGTADDLRFRSAANDPRRRGVVSEPLRRSAEDDPLARGVAGDPRNLNAMDDELEELRRMSHDQDWLGRRPVPAPQRNAASRRTSPAIIAIACAVIAVALIAAVAMFLLR